MSRVDYDPFAEATKIELVSTPAQREIWLSSKLGSGSVCAFNESFSLHLSGSVDEGAMLRALQVLSEIHESLRGHFSPDGELFIIEPVITVPVVKHDLTAHSPSEQDISLRHLLSADSEAPFDLEAGPLFRGAIIRLNVREYVVTFSAHHAVCDGWSLDVLLSDLAKLYSAFAGSAPLPAPPRHGFTDYLSFCRTPEHAARVEASRAFWRQVFQVLPSALDISHDGVRPAVRSYGARHMLYDLSTDILPMAKKLSRAHGLSFFSVLLSTLAVLLHRLSGAEDIVIGIPVAGHPDAGMEDCVGHLVNLVPIRCRVASGISFLELCRTSNAALLDARENAWIGFSEIVVDLHVPRDSSRVPLVSAVLTHAQKYAPGKVNFTGCSLEYHLNARRFETFELNLNLIESHKGLQIKVHANEDLYSLAWVEWRMREFECLLRHACSSPELALDELNLLPDEEVQLVTSGFNQTSRSYPPPYTLYELFAKRAVECGEHTALIDAARGNQFSYHEIDHLSGRLAEVLREKGLGNGTIGVCMERGINMVCSLLAIVRAGGTYLPLDPAYPPVRLRLMVDDVHCSAVLTQTDLVQIVRELHGTVVDVQALWPELVKEGPEYSAPAGADSIACVIFTSDSSGVPKGVPNTHRGLVNRLQWMQELLEITPQDRVAQQAPLSLDVSFWETLWPLLFGGTLVIIDQGSLRDSSVLVRKLRDTGVTIVHFSPPALSDLLREPSAVECTDLRAVLCSGEALSAALRDKHTRIFSIPLYNLYGPVEATGDVAFHVVDPADQRPFVPIGRPVANTYIYILDEHGRPQPVAVTGELFIAGVQVAPGYMHRASLTSERFITDPLTSGTNRQLFRTGDKARWHADGTLEYQGRNDRQIKINGTRIELDDVESTLRRHSSVADVMVVARQVSGRSELAALVVGRKHATVKPAALKEHCQSSLPPVMVPAYFETVESLPPMSKGKVDYINLPKSDEALQAGSVSAAPSASQSSAERTIHEIWAKHLGTSDFKTGDNFFDIGGNSFLTVRIVADLEEAFGRTFSVTDMFQYPTVAAFARNLSADMLNTADSAIKAADRARLQRESLKGRGRPR